MCNNWKSMLLFKDNCVKQEPECIFTCEEGILFNFNMLEQRFFEISEAWWESNDCIMTDLQLYMTFIHL